VNYSSRRVTRVRSTCRSSHARSVFRVAEFGERAAVEAAALTRDALATGAKGAKFGVTPDANWAKVKFDRQIVAIARVTGATCIYTTDDQLARHAKAVGIDAIHRDGLPVPSVEPQLEMKLAPVDAEPDPDEDGEL
jgi:hypothetical protein